MTLAKSPAGGYYNPKTFRDQTKVEVEEVLAMQEQRSSGGRLQVQISDDELNHDNRQNISPNFHNTTKETPKEQDRDPIFSPKAPKQNGMVFSNDPTKSFFAGMGKTEFDNLSFAQRSIDPEKENQVGSL